MMNHAERISLEASQQEGRTYFKPLIPNSHSDSGSISPARASHLIAAAAFRLKSAATERGGRAAAMIATDGAETKSEAHSLQRTLSMTCVRHEPHTSEVVLLLQTVGTSSGLMVTVTGHFPVAAACAFWRNSSAARTAANATAEKRAMVVGE